MTDDVKNASKSEKSAIKSTEKDLVKIIPRTEDGGAYEIIVRGEKSGKKTIVRTTPRPFALTEAG